jgi:hypothetical protein
MGWSPIESNKTRAIPDKPATSMLKTQEVAEADLSNSRVGLAIEVEDILGYTPLRTDVKAPSRLERALSELEIETFKQETVDAYKKQMRDHFYGKAQERDLERSIGRQQYNPMGYYVTEVSWQRVDLGTYKQPVPEHILRKCVQIKKAIPEATFQVDELKENSRVVDPFMVVTLGSESLYFEVWDEPKFEASL